MSMKVTGLSSVESWAAAVACSIINLLLVLPGRIYGLLYVAFLESYNVDRQHASYPVLISFSVRCFSGCFMGYFGQMFGCRAITFWGCLLGTVAFGACFLAEDMLFIYISFGLFYGLGTGMAQTLLPEMIKQHFDKYFSQATGVTLTGYCLSAFIGCPAYEYFVKEYGKSGALLLISGIMLHALPAAIFLKNPNYKTMPTAGAHKPNKKNKNKEDCSYIAGMHVKLVDTIETPAPTIDIDPPPFDTVQSHSDSNVCPFPREIIAPQNLPQKVIAPLNLNSSSKTTATLCEICIQKNTYSPSLKNNMTSIDNCISHPEGSLRSFSCSACSTPHKLSQIAEDGHEIAWMISGTPCKYIRRKAVWKSLNLFIDPSYIIILLDFATHGVLLLMILTIIVDMSRDKGIPRDKEMYMLMLLPVTEFFGYVGLGWVTDGEYLTYANFCCSGFVGLSLICGFLVWSYNFVTMMIGVLLFGVLEAATSATFSPLIYKYIDEEKQSLALSSRFALYAPLNFTIGPMIGYFRENIGSYDWMLYIMGISCLLVGILNAFLLKTSSFKGKKKGNGNFDQ